MKFLQSSCLLPTMLVLCMWTWWKLMKEYPMVHAWLIQTRLPPFKCV
jgi:hypothetical protein